MPQKRNPRHSEVILGIARIVRQHCVLALETMSQEHERTGAPRIVEWAVLPESFVLASGALHEALALTGGLVVDRARMRENLGLTRGLISAEPVMMALARRLGRPRAHGVVYAACRLAEREGCTLCEALRSDPRAMEHLTEEELSALADPARHVGLAGHFVDVVVRKVTSERI